MKIIKIGAIWCPGCLVMNSIINKVKDEYNIEVKEYDYDIDAEVVTNYEVGNILPVFIFVDKDDREITRLIGEKKKKEFDDIINKYM